MIIKLEEIYLDEEDLRFICVDIINALLWVAVWLVLAF